MHRTNMKITNGDVLIVRKKYTGETGRNFDEGLKELFFHSKFSQHLLQHGHSFRNVWSIA